MPEIRKASTIEGGVLRRFYADAFPARADFLAQHWRWLYRVGRFPGIEPLVLVEKERVVGHAGVIPVELSRLGGKATAIWFVDFALLPELQGQGHGKTLAAAWMAMCPDHITFCNERSINVFRKLGWKERSGASVLTQPLELSAPMKRFGPLGAALGRFLNLPWLAAQRVLLSHPPRLKTTPLPMDAGGLAELLGNQAETGAHIVHDAEWFKWRLLENPRREEHLLARTDEASAIFRLFMSLGRRRAHLLYVGPGSASARAGMVKAFARWALDNNADDAWLATSEASLLSAAAPYLLRRHALRFAWHSSAAPVCEALASPLATQGIDSDHDLMFP